MPHPPSGGEEDWEGVPEVPGPGESPSLLQLLCGAMVLLQPLAEWTPDLRPCGGMVQGPLPPTLSGKLV